MLATQTGSEELAMAFSTRSQLDMLSNDAASCIAWGNRAIDLARTLDAQDVLAHALNNVGIARLQLGEPEGQAQLEESLQIALERDFHEHAARAYTNLATCLRRAPALRRGEPLARARDPLLLRTRPRILVDLSGGLAGPPARRDRRVGEGLRRCEAGAELAARSRP